MKQLNKWSIDYLLIIGISIIYIRIIFNNIILHLVFIHMFKTLIYCTYPGRSFRWPDPFKSESVPVQFLSIPVGSSRFRSDPANSLSPDSDRKFKGNFRLLPGRFRSDVCRNWTELVAETLNGIRLQGNRRNRNRAQMTLDSISNVTYRISYSMSNRLCISHFRIHPVMLQK